MPPASCKVVGMVAGGRQHVVAHARENDPVLLVPEPTNPYDKHAVAVYTAPRATLLHPDDLVSSLRRPDTGGAIHDEDRQLLMDRQAGYLPKEVAARLDLPTNGVVGYISAIRWKPREDGFDHAGRAVTHGEDIVAGFDVSAEFTYRDQP